MDVNVKKNEWKFGKNVSIEEKYESNVKVKMKMKMNKKKNEINKIFKNVYKKKD